MINKKYKKGSSWKGLMLFPVSIVLLFFMACGNEEPVNQQVDDPLHESANPENSNALTGDISEPIAEEIFYIVEEMPQWPGSDNMAEAMQLFIAQNLKYPEIAKSNNVEGKVFVHFMVTSTGKVVVPDPDILPPPLKKEDGTLDEVVVVTYRTLNSEQEIPDAQGIQALKDEAVRVVELMPDLVPAIEQPLFKSNITSPDSFRSGDVGYHPYLPGHIGHFQQQESPHRLAISQEFTTFAR
jgi:hypothetical protein